MKYIVAAVLSMTLFSHAVAGVYQRADNATFDPIHSLEHCYKQQFPACSGGGDGGGGQ